ncbi:hypothetical protein ACFYXH_27060 [Streptomyces sp. NPDC002730]|uniref:hypothetical protein n=1 Tax=Streptomyces sp. NPDC002730 TaxID=3364662 RepID=UPI00368DC096
MTGVVVFFFLAAALFVALGLADQRKLYWKLSSWRYRNPEANEPSDTAYAIGRVVVFAAAGIMVFQGCSAMNFADETSWSKSEFNEAVQSAAVSLGDESHVDSSAGGYASLIESKVGDAGEGKGPSYAVEAKAVGESDDYEVTARGEDFVFCMHVSQSESGEGGFAVPGADGSSTVVPEYELTATAVEGSC